jgi:hypothetical protein
MANRVDPTTSDHVCNACNDDLAGTASTWACSLALWVVVCATCAITRRSLRHDVIDAASNLLPGGPMTSQLPPLNLFLAFFAFSVFSHLTRVLFSGRYVAHRPAVAHLGANKGYQNLLRRLPTLSGAETLHLGRAVQVSGHITHG